MLPVNSKKERRSVQLWSIGVENVMGRAPKYGNLGNQSWRLTPEKKITIQIQQSSTPTASPALHSRVSEWEVAGVCSSTPARVKN